MADYPDISQLNQIDVATPSGNEVASKLNDAVLQIKKFLSVYLAVAHNNDGTLKNNAAATAAIPDDSVTYAKLQNVSATNKVLGRATAGAGNVEEIDCTPFARTILDDVDAATVRATLGLAALALKATIAEADIDALAVTTGKLANLGVTAAKIADATITGGKIADSQVTAGKLGWVGASDANPHLMVGGTTNAEATIGGVLKAVLSAGVLEFSFASTVTPGSGADTAGVAYARLEEQRAANTGAGGTTATTWVDRTGWVENDPAGLVSISGANITFAKKGVYWVRISVPCSGAVGFHRCKLVNTSGPSDIKIGSTEQCAAGVTTRSHLWEIVTIAADATTLKVQTWATNTVATTGLGAPSNQGDAEIYGIMEIVKL